MVSNKVVRVHVCMWFLYTFYLTSLIKYFYNVPLSVEFISQTILHRLGDIMLFYVNCLFIFPKFFSIKKSFLFILAFILGAGLYIFYFYLLEFYVFKSLSITVPEDNPSFIQVISQAVLTGSNFIIFSLGYY